MPLNTGEVSLTKLKIELCLLLASNKLSSFFLLPQPGLLGVSVGPFWEGELTGVPGKDEESASHVFFFLLLCFFLADTGFSHPSA